MKADLTKALRKINDFYGLALKDEQIKLVQEKTTFFSMKEKSSNTHGDLGNVFFRKGKILKRIYPVLYKQTWRSWECFLQKR
ncbi:hypothetical protein AB205_0071750 [Aquarana catesbeiana]|uniref:Sulfotransferase n=1 Tax=Aquarana catesbeiana TaxID=8400 RepID=A0A2G9R7M9_AQUCT|nr:hypothetical protein AB205_0071750 [Aquarana catesbeiana]